MRALRLQAAVLALVVGALCGAAATAHADPGISGKRAQLHGVLVELQRLDAAAQRANSRYQIESQRLVQVEHRLAVNRQALGVAHANLRQSRRTLAKRLVAIYTSSDQQSSLAVLLGAKSLDDLISRLEAESSISSQDTALLHQVLSFQRQIVRNSVLLRRERVRQHRLVVLAAAARNQAESKLAAEQHLADSVKGQLDRLISAQQAAQRAAAQRAEAAAKAQITSAQLGGFGFSATGGSTPPGRFGSVVSIAMQYLGVPYVWGGASPSGFDCSGLVMYVYAQVGVSLPHNAAAQWDYPNSVYVPRADLEPGDLVFFYDLGHVGIYVGNGEFIDAPYTGVDVRIESLNGLSGAYYGAKRILG